MPSQRQIFLPVPSNLESNGMTSKIRGLAAKTASNWRPLQSLFFNFIWIAFTSEAGKVECLLDLVQAKRKEVSFLE